MKNLRTAIDGGRKGVVDRPLTSLSRLRRSLSLVVRKALTEEQRFAIAGTILDLLKLCRWRGGRVCTTLASCRAGMMPLRFPTNLYVSSFGAPERRCPGWVFPISQRGLPRWLGPVSSVSQGLTGNDAGPLSPPTSCFTAFTIQKWMVSKGRPSGRPLLYVPPLFAFHLPRRRSPQPWQVELGGQ